MKIHEAKGLPKDLSHFVFCQYSFWGYEDSVSVPPEISPDTLVEKRNTKTVKFTHERVGIQSVFCQYSFWGYEDSVSVPPEISPDTLVEKRNTKTVKFTHERVGCTLHFRNTEFLC